MSIFRNYGIAWFGALCLGAAQAATPAFAKRCEALAADARIAVVFEDAVVARDDSRGLEELRNMSRLSTGPYHQVYGLTRALAGARYAMRVAYLADTDGSVCAAPSIELTLAVAELTVYLAREMTNPCKRAIVDAHEAEHVAVVRSHLKVAARLLEPVLRGQFGQPSYSVSVADARESTRSRVDGVLKPLLKNLQDGITQANREIDSPLSYQATEQRLQACP